MSLPLPQGDAQEWQLQAPGLPEEPAIYDVEEDLCMLSRTYFDTCEYERAAQLLEKAKSHKAVFLKNYALYMVYLRARHLWGIRF